MIIFDSWIGKVPKNERVLGFSKDNLAIEKEFLIRGEDISNWSVQLFWKTSKEKNGLCVLVPCLKDDGTHFLWKPTREILQDSGILQIQLRGIYGDKQKHTNILEFMVFNTLPDLNDNMIPLTETEKLAKFFQKLKNQTNTSLQNEKETITKTATKAEKAASDCNIAVDKASNATSRAISAADAATTAANDCTSAKSDAQVAAKQAEDAAKQLGIEDTTNNKRYFYQIKIVNGKPVLYYDEANKEEK